MIKVLSKEESFFLLQRKFVELKEKDVIDLCYRDRRYPAIVVSVDREANSFRVLPLDESGVADVLEKKLPEEVEVIIPRTAEEVHPMWNKV
jgi:hypothetical protein